MLPALVGFGVILYIRHKQMTIPLEYSNVTAVIFPVVIFALHYGGVIVSSKFLALYWSAYIAVRMEGTVSFVNYIGLTCLWNWLLILYFVMPFTLSASVKRILVIGFTIWSVLLLLYGHRANMMDIRYFFLGWGPLLVRLWFTGFVVKHRMNPVVGAVFVLAVMGSQTLLSYLWIFGFMGFPSAGASGADLAEFFAYMAGAVVLFMARKRCL